MSGNKQTRVAVVCGDLDVTGGLLRFERFGRVAARMGCEVAFVSLKDSPSSHWETQFAFITYAEAARQTWSATMVPGAGFADEVIDRLPLLKQPQFGTRIQHVLNDTRRKEAFLRVNDALRPHRVVFNNRHWDQADVVPFRAATFHWIEGGIDIEAFAPSRMESAPTARRPLVVAGLANKNPEPLLQAARLLPGLVSLRLFGDASQLPYAADLVGSGQLELLGVLKESELPNFYRSVDCVVHTEAMAGWANLAAEALASGRPLVCTPHGTAAFARHEQTALVVEPATGPSVAAALERLATDSELVRSLVRAGIEEISRFSWGIYAERLLALLPEPSGTAYYMEPSLGLYGKWPLDRRQYGLEALEREFSRRSVLDLGCAEGLISRHALEAGASLLHGLEIDETRLNVARNLCADYPHARFWSADLAEWASVHRSHEELLLREYDIVLYLGVHHHLPPEKRMQTLLGAAACARRFFAVRTPADVWRTDNILARLNQTGLVRITEMNADAAATVFARHE